jgi:hypothetical protein
MAAKPKKIEIFVTLEAERFAVNMFFNRFSVETLGRHRLIHFGLVVRNETMAQYSTVLEANAIQQSRSSMLDYLGTIGTVDESEPEKWRPLLEGGTVNVSNVIHMSHSGDSAEVRFGVYSSGVALEHLKKATGKVNLAGNPLALLRCDVELQKLLIIQLYSES